MANRFRIGLTRDLLDSHGKPSFGAWPLALLDGAGDWEFMPESVSEITPEIAARYDALYVNSPKMTAASVARPDSRLRIVARHGVGYDSVDIAAMSAAGIVVTNTPEAVRRPVATMAVTFVLALAQKLLIKDRLTRAGRWQERTDHMGQGLTGKVLGVIGAGSIGLETLRMIAPFEMELIAADPYGSPEKLTDVGATLVPLDELLARADFVIVACLLNEATRHLVNAQRLKAMKPSAYLINVARGPIVDERALIEALNNGTIAGAGLDVFEQEPVDPANPLLTMENVVVTPHALCWTDENFGNIARDGLGSIVDLLARRRPRHIVNPEVLEHARLRAWFSAAGAETQKPTTKIEEEIP
jgi:D-3-phosphoglycerate dehydrogenase